MFKHTIGTTYQSNNGSVSVPSLSLTGDGEVAIDRAIPAGTTNLEITLGLDISAVKAYVIAASKPGAGKSVTVKTNSTSSPGNTITLTDAAPAVVWYTGSVLANPLTADVTALFVSSDSAGEVSFRVAALIDATPNA